MLLDEGIICLTYMLVCMGLLRSCFSRKAMWGIMGILLGSIGIVQAAFLFGGQDDTLLITLLPVTAYLPFSIGIFLMTGFRSFQTAVVWALGLLPVYILRILKKLMIWYTWPELSVSLALLLTAALLVFFIFRFAGRPFGRYMERKPEGWQWLCFPALMSYLLLSWFVNSVMNVSALVLALLIVLSVFFLMIRLVISQTAIADMEQSRREIELRMQMQRREYEDVCKKMEAGRIYRHDMRHHLLVLQELAVQEDVKGIAKYLDNMSGQLSEAEREVYCDNSTVNAVLSACILQAREAHCSVTASIHLPEEVPFDEMDICMVLANALENARNACEEIGEKQNRYIHITVELVDRRKLLISVKNPCHKVMRMDENGIPVTSKSGEHGIGLKSVRAVTDKYDGFLQCKCEGGTFLFRAVLFGGKPLQQPVVLTEKGSGVWRKIVSAVPLFLVAMFLCLSRMSTAVQAFEDAPGEEVTIQLNGEQSWKTGWGDTQVDLKYPRLEMEISSLGENASAVAAGAEEMNRQIEAYVGEIKEQFMEYLTRKCGGYVECDTTWNVLRDDDSFLSVRVEATVNAGGSANYSRCFTLDKSSGKVLELKDLFPEDSDYVGLISGEILRQMEEKVQKEGAMYFIPGGIWSDEECFKQIAPDQNFYINEQDQLVILFDEYEVAPGSMGSPKFVIDLQSDGED